MSQPVRPDLEFSNEVARHTAVVIRTRFRYSSGITSAPSVEVLEVGPQEALFLTFVPLSLGVVVHGYVTHVGYKAPGLYNILGNGKTEYTTGWSFSACVQSVAIRLMAKVIEANEHFYFLLSSNSSAFVRTILVAGGIVIAQPQGAVGWYTSLVMVPPIVKIIKKGRKY